MQSDGCAVRDSTQLLHMAGPQPTSDPICGLQFGGVPRYSAREDTRESTREMSEFTRADERVLTRVSGGVLGDST
eukprot:2025408-Rhodomonas_salina.1